MNKFYPTACSDFTGVTFSFNLGQEKFKFNIDDHFNKEVNKIFAEINKTEVPKTALVDLVSAYLYVNGHHGSLISFEAFRNFERSPMVKLLKKQPSGPFNASATPHPSSQSFSSLANTSVPRESRAFAPEKEGSFLTALKKLFHKTSKSDLPNGTIEEKDPKLSVSPELSEESGFLERSSIRREIVFGRIEEAENIFSSVFPSLYKNHLGVQALFTCLTFLKVFQKDETSALLFAKENFRKELLCQKIQYFDAAKKAHSFELRELMSLFATKSREESRFSQLFSKAFLHYCADQLNSYILCRLSLSS